MTRQDILRETLQQAEHNLNCYSKDWMGDTPKDGFANEHKAAREKVLVLKQLLDEQPRHEYREERHNSVICRTFIGTIAGWECRQACTEDKHPYVSMVRFTIKGTSCDGCDITSGDQRLFEIGSMDRDLGREWLLSGKYDIERHRRYDEGKTDTMKILVEGVSIVDMAWAEA